MPTDHTRRVSEIDPRSVEVHFAPEVRQAFGDLAAAVHFSEHFDGDMLSVLQDWSAGKRQSIHDVLIAFPAIATETFKHIHATGDPRAAEAWSAIGNEMLERGFALGGSRKTPSKA